LVFEQSLDPSPGTQCQITSQHTWSFGKQFHHCIIATLDTVTGARKQSMDSVFIAFNICQNKSFNRRVWSFKASIGRNEKKPDVARSLSEAIQLSGTILVNIYLIPPKRSREELSLCNPYLMGFGHANLKYGTQQVKTPQNYTK